jgi:GPH family glycoside/pentoside/hexuronide:cation symporter
VSNPHPIAVSDRIPFFQKICFAAGVNMDYAATGLMSMLWMPVFNIGYGLSPVTLSVVFMIFRGWDAFADPVMGNISDNTHTRWGRRRPYMFAGAILTAAVYPFFWYMPADWSLHAKEIYLTSVGLVFFSMFTSWSMPYYGMQLELTPNYDERSRLTAWMAVCGKLFYLGAGWFMPFVLVLGSVALGEPGAANGQGAFFTKLLMPLQSWLSSLPGVNAGEKPIVVGMRIACWLVVAATLFFGLLPALFTKERYYKAATKDQPKESLIKSIRETFSCRPLWILIGVSFFLSIGTNSVSNLGQYVNIYYVNAGDITKASVIGGWKSTLGIFIGLATLPLFIKLGETYGKRRITLVVLGLAVFGHILNYGLMTPDHPYWVIIPGVFESCALSVFWMFLPSMKADVADYDELHTSRRREGSINAFYSWLLKLAGTLAIGLGGLVLNVSGFDIKVGDHQPPEVLNRMFYIYLLIPLVAWGVSIAILWRYPLGRARSEQIRADLEARRGAL